MNSAHETPDQRRARIYPIILKEYNSAWPAWFREEKQQLQRLIDPDWIVGIHHYGSTSVPGLLAKPTIDILLEIAPSADISRLKAALPAPEYICLNGDSLTTPAPPPHLMFLKGYLADGFAEKVYHIHVVYSGDHPELKFRDYLRTHPAAAAEYAKLKRELLSDFQHNRDGYTQAKSAFIQRALGGFLPAQPGARCNGVAATRPAAINTNWPTKTFQ